jgi:hypothetical protein
MKTIIYLTVAFAFNYVNAQTYSYAKLTKKANVETSTGKNIKTIGTYSGPYTFIFETPTDPSMERLFTLLKPGQSNGPGLPFYGQLQDLGYIEKNEILFKKYLYYDTESKNDVLVLIAENYSSIVIFKSNHEILEFTD